MKVFTILASVALAPHVQGFGDTPGSFDICGSTCESFDTDWCSVSWDIICFANGFGGTEPPEGFHGESQLYELCPEGECNAGSPPSEICDECHANYIATGCTDQFSSLVAGDTPASEIDLCGHTCATVITEFGAPCTSTWAEGCQDEGGHALPPPQGFSVDSTLGEMCPTECPSHPFEYAGCSGCGTPDFTLCPDTIIRKIRCDCEATGDLTRTDFCNYDYDGGGVSCEACENFQTPDDCYNEGLPPAGAADCEVRCFSGPCGCEDGTNFCNYDEGGASCEACENFQTPDDCYNDGIPLEGASDCEARCFVAHPFYWD